MNPTDLEVIKATVLTIKDDVVEIKQALMKFEERLRGVETEQAVARARMGIFSVIASSIGIIAAAIAAFLGMR